MSETELILNADGSVYHLDLLPEDIADTIFLVGDPGRVEMVSKYFDEVRVRKQKREFITHTGRVGARQLTVLSTGIGTDNIDIVLNELDALVNLDLESREVKSELRSLTLIRLGTSGALQPDIPLDSIVVSRYALGLDALARMQFRTGDHTAQAWFDALEKVAGEKGVRLHPAYMTSADASLVTLFSAIAAPWITVTCAGFYGLQGRSIRIPSTEKSLMYALRDFEFGGMKAGNIEMESAGIFLLASLLGHRAVSLNAIIGNRTLGTFSHDPDLAVDEMIRKALDILPER